MITYSQSLRSTLVVCLTGILFLFAASACKQATPSAPARIEPPAWPEPEHLPSAAELDLHPERWNGHYVECEGDLSYAFEVYRLEPHTWLHNHPDIVITGPQPPRGKDRKATRSRVRVVGFAHTSVERQGYGHLSSYSSMIVITHLTYLSPPKPLYE